MKRIMMIGLLLSANAALAATDGAIPSLTVPNDMKCSTRATPAGSEVSCVSANPPVAYIDAEGRECHGVQGIPSSFSCKEKVPPDTFLYSTMTLHELMGIIGGLVAVGWLLRLAYFNIKRELTIRKALKAVHQIRQQRFLTEKMSGHSTHAG